MKVESDEKSGIYVDLMPRGGIGAAYVADFRGCALRDPCERGLFLSTIKVSKTRNIKGLPLHGSAPVVQRNILCRVHQLVLVAVAVEIRM